MPTVCIVTEAFVMDRNSEVIKDVWAYRVKKS
jgi:hypothetical protein